jgi:preprotein translocase subunit SecD
MLVFSRAKTVLILGVCALGILLTALTFAPPERLPSWAPHPHVNLGLDLQGGAPILLTLGERWLTPGRPVPAGDEAALARG